MDMATVPPTMGTGTPPTTATAIPPTEWHTPIQVGDMGTTRVAPTMATRMRLERRLVGTIRVGRIVPTRSRRDGEEVTTGAGADSAGNRHQHRLCACGAGGKPWSAVWWRRIGHIAV